MNDYMIPESDNMINLQNGLASDSFVSQLNSLAANPLDFAKAQRLRNFLAGLLFKNPQLRFLDIALAQDAASGRVCPVLCIEPREWRGVTSAQPVPIQGFPEAITLPQLSMAHLPRGIDGTIDLTRVSDGLLVTSQTSQDVIDQVVAATKPGSRARAVVSHERDLDAVTELPAAPFSPRPGIGAACGSTGSKRLAVVDGVPLGIRLDRPKTLGELLECRAQNGSGGYTFIESSGEHRCSAAEFYRDALGVAGQLAELGYPAGTPVVLQLGQGREHLLALWGTVMADLVPAMPSSASSYTAGVVAAEQLPQLCGRIGAAAIITTAARRAPLEKWLAERLDEPLPVFVPDPDHVPAIPVERDPDDVALMLFTSGSSGLPKAVPLRHRMILAEAEAVARAIGVDSTSIGFNWMPLDHAGLLLGHVVMVWAGGRQNITQTEVVMRQPGSWMRWMSDLRATNSWAPNWAFAQALEEFAAVSDIDLRCVRTLVSGGEVVNPIISRRFLEAFASFGLSQDAVVPTFGMAETCSASILSTAFRPSPGLGTLLPGERIPELRNEFTELGVPVPGVSIRIVGVDGRPVPEGVQGELQVRGECVFDGYIGRDRAADFDDDWFRTGDVGVIVDGRLALTGRAKDIVILNGRNFCCAEVETALSDVPEIVPSSTVAAPFIDPDTGTEELAVFFVPEGSVGDEAAAVALRERLSMALQIQARALVPVDPAEIPRTAIGKPVRPVLGRRLAEGAFPRAIRTGAGPSRDADPARNVIRAAWEPTTVGPAIFTTPGLVLDLSEHVADWSLGWRWPDAELCRLDMLANRLEAAGPGVNIVLPALSWASVSTVFDMLRSTMQRTKENVATWTVMTRSGGPAHSGLAGAVRSLLAHERRAAPDGITLRHLHVLGDVSADRLAAVLAAAWPTDVLRLDEHGGCRHVLRSVALPRASAPHLRSGGRYVVTGGAGGIGRHVCRMLLDEVGARVLVVGRSAAPDMTKGCRYAQADVTAPGRLREAVERFEAETGAPIDGIFHLAGVGDIRSQWTSSVAGGADGTTADWLDRMSGEKLAGTIACADLVAERGDARLVLFSSVMGYTGGLGDPAYPVSNAAQQAIFEDLPAAVRERATCLEWSMWRDIGMSRDCPAPALAAAEAGGFRVLNADAALRTLRAALCAGWGHRLMLGVDPEAVSLRSDVADPRTSRLRVLVEGVPVAKVDQARRAIDALDLRIPVELCPVPVLPDGPLTEPALAHLLDKAVVTGNPDNADDERTPTERALGRLFAEVLQAVDPGPDANFMQLGGHSLSAARLASRIAAELDVELPMVAVFEHPVLGGLAAVIDRARAAAPSDPVGQPAGEPDLKLVPAPARHPRHS